MDAKTFDALVYDRNIVELQNHAVYAKDAKVGDVVICGTAYALVLSIHEWPVGHTRREDAPIWTEMVAVEVVTTNGSRWYGKPNLS